MEIEIDNRSQLCVWTEEWETVITQAIEASLEAEGLVSGFEISVSIVDAEEIREINKRFRGIDQETDVLSFPLLDGDAVRKGGDQNQCLGDIVVCWNRVVLQAEDYGHSLNRELGFLVTHSMLHLFGYDHQQEQQEQKMIEKQNDILNRIGLRRE